MWALPGRVSSLTSIVKCLFLLSLVLRGHFCRHSSSGRMRELSTIRGLYTQAVPILHVRDLQGSSLLLFSCCIDRLNFSNMDFQHSHGFSHRHVCAVECVDTKMCLAAFQLQFHLAKPSALQGRGSFTIHLRLAGLVNTLLYIYCSSAELATITPHKC